jgi:hypothetical protein
MLIVFSDLRNNEENMEKKYLTLRSTLLAGVVGHIRDDLYILLLSNRSGVKIAYL